MDEKYTSQLKLKHQGVYHGMTFGKLAAIVIAAIGTLAAIITIYVFVSQSKKIKLQYEIMANTNVLDIHTELTKLDILYDGQSLKRGKDNLRIMNIKIVNNGSENILKTFYDDNDPLGFTILNGKIIENPEILETSCDYLNQNLAVSLDSLGRVKFSKVIIEPNDYFVLKVLILHKSEISPDLVPVGKIAGVRIIDVIDVSSIKESEPFVKEVFAGNILIQVFRALAYIIFIIILIIIIAIIATTISSWKEKRKRRKFVEEFKLTKDYYYKEVDDVIFRRYEKEGIVNLINYRTLLKDKLLLDKKHVFSEKERAQINNMIAEKYVTRNRDILLVNQELEITLEWFIDFLEKKGE